MNGFEDDFNPRETQYPSTNAPRAPAPPPPRRPPTYPEQQQHPNQQYPGEGGGGGGGMPQQHAQYPNAQFPNYPGVGRSDLLDALWSAVNQDLLIAKTFYFFFFSAFGSLFPLMAIFFKQLGMNPVQCGLLIGFRPFVEFLSAPFWGTIADRYQKGKQILLFSLMCWVIFTLTLCFISPPAASCIYYNSTHHHHYLADPDQTDGMEKRSVHQQLPSNWSVDFGQYGNEYESRRPAENGAGQSTFWLVDDNRSDYAQSYGRADDVLHRQRRKNKLPPGHVIGQSPDPVHFTVNYDPKKHSNLISPVFSTIVYKKQDVQSVFFVILLLVVIGEFFSAPAITLADSVTLTYLGENANNYGKQRMFGSLGWGLAMFFVGIALDHSTVFPNHPCGPHERERNYTICFAVFSVLMGCAFIAATQFRFDYDAIDDNIPMKSMPDAKMAPQNNFMSNTEAAAANLEQPPPPFPDVDKEPKPEKSTVFASKAKQIPEWWRVLRTFANLRYGAFLFVAWFMGLGVGFVFTFLFWHLQDLGGTPTLFGVASVINHISEIFAYFFSFRLIRQIGHVRVLCLGLLGNLARFLYISWLHNPWWVLPFEFIQGVTHAAVWAACCSYITQATPMNLRSSAQGVLQGLHHGLGRGCGAVFGGLLATYCGTAVTFRTYGFICLIVLVAFIFINYYEPEHGFASAESVEPHQVLEESSHLAPHGVPSGPMPRALSSSRLEDMGNNGHNYPGYGTTEKQNGPFLDLPNYGGKFGGGGGGGGWGNADVAGYSNEHDGQSWSNMENLTEALNIKRNSHLASPQSKCDYDYIQENFKAYSDVLNSDHYNSYFIDDDVNYGNVQLLKAPPPRTIARKLQPVNQRCESLYDF